MSALIYQALGKNRKNEFVYSTNFQAMLDNLDDEDGTEEIRENSCKKRRLRYDQVKALEKMFEVDNKLEAEKKLRIAEELGLQPRQVSIWFQNRRARRKTKMLERDYGVLKANYEDLKLNFEKLKRENEDLIAERKELKSNPEKENTEKNHSVKEGTLFLKTENKVSQQSKVSLTTTCQKLHPTNQNCEVQNRGNPFEIKASVGFNDGLWDKSCSEVFDEENSLSSSMSSTWMNCFQFVKMEEHDLFSTEDSSNFFSVDQAPTLYWQH